MPSLKSWLRNLTRPAGRKLTPARRPSTRLTLEPLEDRVTPTTITFSEPVQTTAAGGGFNGKTNEFLLSNDGLYRVETFWVNVNGGHFHIHLENGDPDPSNLAEHNHNNSNSTNGGIGLQGFRITRLDARPFNLVQMNIFWQASVGQMTNFATGAAGGSGALPWALWNGPAGSTIIAPGVVSFGTAYTNLSYIDIVDPAAAGGTSSPVAGPNGTFEESWDNIVLSLDNKEPQNVSAGGPYNVDEGSSVALSGNATDPDAGDVLTFSWDLNNDGTFETPGKNVNFSAAGRDGPSTQIVNMRVDDGNGNVVIASTVVNILNVRPRLSNLSITPNPVSEGGTVHLTGNITDPGIPDTFILTVNWGDATINYPFAAGTTFFDVTHQYRDDNPTGTQSDTFNVLLNLADDDGGTDTGSVSLTVNNVRPTISNLAATSINENGTTTLTGFFSDLGTLDTFSLSINWGNGTQNITNIPAGAFSFTHQYLDDDPTGTLFDDMPISVTVTDDDNGVGTSNTTVRVSNLAPTTLILNANTGNPGAYVIEGSFADIGTLDTHTVGITWGAFGSTLVNLPLGTKTFSIPYNGAMSDLYGTTISVVVRDDDTGFVTGTLAVENAGANRPPIITLLTNDSPGCGCGDDDGPDLPGVREGSTLTVSGTFIDPDTADTHTATINWGDGSSSPAIITESGGAGTIRGTHIYANGGIYTITVTLFDNHGASDTETTEAAIIGAGVVNGTLYVIGTDDDDHVTVSMQGTSKYKVQSNYFSTPFKTFAAAPVTKVMVILCDGDDKATVASSVKKPTLIDTGEGNDQLNGGKGPNILLGGDGADMLIGGAGNDLFIGGRGADRVVGNSGEDILIGGRTAFDCDYDALFALSAEWACTTRSLAARVANIDGTADPLSPSFLARKNGDNFLRADGPDATVFDDNVYDMMTGSSGKDWFFARVTEPNADVLTDYKSKSGDMKTDLP